MHISSSISGFVAATSTPRHRSWVSPPSPPLWAGWPRRIRPEQETELPRQEPVLSPAPRRPREPGAGCPGVGSTRPRGRWHQQLRGLCTARVRSWWGHEVISRSRAGQLLRTGDTRTLTPSTGSDPRALRRWPRPCPATTWGPRGWRGLVSTTGDLTSQTSTVWATCCGGLPLPTASPSQPQDPGHQEAETGGLGHLRSLLPGVNPGYQEPPSREYWWRMAAVMAVLAVSPEERAATMTTLWTARCIFMKNWEGPAPEVFLPVKWRKIEKLPPQHPPTTSLVARIWHPPCRLLRTWAL